MGPGSTLARGGPKGGQGQGLEFIWKQVRVGVGASVGGGSAW